MAENLWKRKGRVGSRIRGQEDGRNIVRRCRRNEEKGEKSGRKSMKKKGESMRKECIKMHKW